MQTYIDKAEFVVSFKQFLKTYIEEFIEGNEVGESHKELLLDVGADLEIYQHAWEHADVHSDGNGRFTVPKNYDRCCTDELLGRLEVYLKNNTMEDVSLGYKESAGGRSLTLEKPELVLEAV